MGQKIYQYYNDNPPIEVTDPEFSGILRVPTIDVDNITIHELIYDSANSPGSNGSFLSRDADGVRWVSFEPSFTEGIFIQDEGDFIPLVGAAQSFSIINFVQRNSLGLGTDTLIPIPDPASPTFVAQIQTKDLWGYTSTGDIYRMTNVGIRSAIPQYTLDVLGTFNVSDVSTFGASVDIAANLSVYNDIIGGRDFSIAGRSTLNGFLDVNASADISGALNVGSATTIGGFLDVNASADILGALNVGSATTIGGFLDVNASADILESVNVGKDVTINRNLLVVGITTINNILQVDSATYLNSSLDVDAQTILRSVLDVLGPTTLYDVLNANGQTNLNNLNVAGVSTFVGITTVLTDLSVGRNFNVAGVSTFIGNVTFKGGTIGIGDSNTDNVVFTADVNSDIIPNLDLSYNLGSETQRWKTLYAGSVSFIDLYVSGVSTFVGVTTNLSTLFANQLSVAGVTTLNNTLNVSGSTNLNDTLSVDGSTDLNNTLNVVGVTTLQDELNVNGPAYLNSILEVGVGGTVLTTTQSGSVGFGSTTPTREVDFQKDVRFQQAIYDSNDNVGFRSEKYQVPRNVLTTVGVDTSGNIISGRFFDAANLIRLNLDFIASEAVGYLKSIDYKNPAFSLTTEDYNSCKDDIKNILKAITYDITRGGNSNSVGAGLSYYNGNTLVHINGTDINGYSIQEASVATIEKAIEISRFVINNSYYPTSYQMQAINGTYADASRLLLRNKDFIAAEAVDRTLNAYPSLVIPNGNQNCIDDIKLVLDAIIYNLQFGGNNRVFDAANFYVSNPVLSGEETESIYAYQQVISIATDVIRNGTVTKISGILNTFNQFKDLSVVLDLVIPRCQNQVSAITSFVGIVTTAIGTSELPNRTEPTIAIPISQIRDLTLQNDSSRGSNTDPDGCANVHSAINVCGQIVTNIIENGPTSAPNVNNPDGKIVWAPAGADSRNIIYVSKYGNDDNNGRTEGAAKLTVASAAEIAYPGDTIMIRSGVYYENNPIGLRTDVSVSGQDLRLVTIIPKNPVKDVFHVRRGCLIENLNFSGENIGVAHTGAGAVAFPPIESDVIAGIAHSTVSGYLDYGPVTEGPSGRWRSPYVRNCTNFMSKSIGLKVDGRYATATNPNSGADLKSMVVDSFTQYNQGGIGVSITNNGYAQLVSIFTINCDIAIYCDSGGACDLTNSNSSFGNYGLYAVGLGATEYTGTVGTYPPTRNQPGVDALSDKVTILNIEDIFNKPQRPYDGQAAYFTIDLNNYGDVITAGLTTTILTEPLRRVKEVKIINGGSGFSPLSPPTVTIRDSSDLTQNPKGPQGIIAEVSPTIDEVTGEITAIDVINSGRNYLPNQTLEVFIDGGDLVGASAEVITEPIYFSVDAATEPTPTGITTITFSEFIPYELFGGEEVALKRISRILTSGHSFEYIGTGVDINTSTPFQGATPIKDNEVVALDGAKIPFTSTDQKGNFDIGEGFQINQPTASIRGRDFSKSIQAEVTPLILALR